MGKRVFLIILAFFMVGMGSLFSEDANPTYESVLGKRKAKSESDKKILKIEQLVYSYIANGSDIKDKQVKELILKQVMEDYPLLGSGKLREVDVPKIRKRADKKASEKYPLTNKELEDQYKKKAEELYQPLPLNTDVTISYKQGPYTKTITGRYFGLTYYNDGVKIENTVIPIFDMSDSDKSKFDAKLRDLRKQQYVSAQIETYQEERKDFSDSILRTKAEEIVKINEKNGFIHSWSKWRTPEEVTGIIINYVIDKEKKKEEEKNQLADTGVNLDRKAMDNGVADQVRLNKKPMDSGIADQAPNQPSEEEKEEGW